MIPGAFGSEIAKIPPMDEVLRRHRSASSLRTSRRLTSEVSEPTRPLRREGSLHFSTVLLIRNRLYVLNWLLKPEEAVMLQTVSRLLPELPLIVMTAVATHLVMSFAQTLMHYKLGHHPMGGKFFRNHINFHHTYYSRDHLVSRTYLGDEGNNTPFFFIPVFLVGACTYLVLPVDLFVAQL